jgi:predicted nicotinamide N-methyase
MRSGADRSSIARARLSWRINQRFKIISEFHTLSDHRFSFTRIIDPDVVLDQVVAEEDRREKLSGQCRQSEELHLPYWAELWESAIGIGQFLIRNKSTRNGLALDLGCGMGFAGMVAQAAGYRVLMADLEPDALLFARLNAPGARTRQLDWRRDRLDERFDLILGADVLYDRKQWEFLEPFWRAHLAKAGSVLLGEPGRQTGDLFAQWIEQRRWRLERREEKVAMRERPIRLFLLNDDGPDDGA